MQRILFLTAVAVFLTLGQAAPAPAQAPKNEAKAAEKKAASEAAPKEESSVTEHTIRLGGQTIPYKATAATILLKNDKGEPTASIFSIAYTRTDVKDLDQRPLAFV